MNVIESTSYKEFQDYFRELGISEKIVEGVYERIFEGLWDKSYVIQPNHSLARVYGIVDDDLDDLVVAVATTNDLALPENPSDSWEGKVDTVEDVIKFVSTFRTKE